MSRLTLLEGRIDAWVERQRSTQYERKASEAKLSDGSYDFKRGRTRGHAIGDSIATFPYVLWVVRRRLWREEAFWCEFGIIVAGIIIGCVWGMGAGQLTTLSLTGLSVLWQEVVNTAAETNLYGMQDEFLGGIVPNRRIGDALEFAASSVAGPAWLWGFSWLFFMATPGWF